MRSSTCSGYKHLIFIPYALPNVVEDEGDFTVAEGHRHPQRRETKSVQTTCRYELLQINCGIWSICLWINSIFNSVRARLAKNLLQFNWVCDQIQICRGKSSIVIMNLGLLGRREEKRKENLFLTLLIAAIVWWNHEPKNHMLSKRMLRSTWRMILTQLF